LTDLAGLRKYLEETIAEGWDHVVIPLLGKFKGELHSRYHLAPMALETASGLQRQRWVDRLVSVREKEGRVQGLAFCDRQGGTAQSHLYEAHIMERLVRVQSLIPGAIPADLDVYEQFGISRSFRRGTTLTA
jgi:hypothetical protein